VPSARCRMSCTTTLRSCLLACSEWRHWHCTSWPPPASFKSSCGCSTLPPPACGLLETVAIHKHTGCHRRMQWQAALLQIACACLPPLTQQESIEQHTPLKACCRADTECCNAPATVCTAAWCVLHQRQALLPMREHASSPAGSLAAACTTQTPSLPAQLVLAEQMMLAKTPRGQVQPASRTVRLRALEPPHQQLRLLQWEQLAV
jgi:hypothetical protein